MFRNVSAIERNGTDKMAFDWNVVLAQVQVTGAVHQQMKPLRIAHLGFSIMESKWE